MASALAVSACSTWLEVVRGRRVEADGALSLMRCVADHWHILSSDPCRLSRLVAAAM